MSKAALAKIAVESSTSYKGLLAVLGEDRFLPFRDEIRATLLSIAQSQLDAWVKVITSFADFRAYETVRRSNLYGRRGLELHGRQFIDRKSQNTDSGRQETIFNNWKADALAGLYVVNEARVIAEADRRFEESKAFFAFRVAEKISKLLPETEDIAPALELHRGVLVGTVACFPRALDRTEFQTLKVSLKTNYRYGENAADGNITVYHQVPCLLLKK